MRVPTAQQAADLELTIKELADLLYPQMVWDGALPLPWVIQLRELTGFEASGSFVWLYPQGLMGGRPGPLTVEAYQALNKLREASAA